MNTMKRILAAALVAAALGGGLWNGPESVKVRGCKPEIAPRSAGGETAGLWDRQDRRRNGTAVAAVRG